MYIFNWGIAVPPRRLKVFISSTVYDLKDERKYVRDLLEGYRKARGIRFTCLASDHPDFPISGRDRADLHSYDICLKKLRECQYAIFLLKTRYGKPIVKDQDRHISITHMEYLEAKRIAIPRFVFLHEATWNAKDKHENGKPQSIVAKKQLPIFGFVDEIRKGRGNWFTLYRTRRDIGVTLHNGLLAYDDSEFVRDVSIPDGTIVEPGQRFKKTWEIRNIGMQTWKNRQLREMNGGTSNLSPDATAVPIPTTQPGAIASITVWFTAGPLPASCESYWKMFDQDDLPSFPSKVGLFCRVKIAPRPDRGRPIRFRD